jgi:hypothetical protein
MKASGPSLTVPAAPPPTDPLHRETAAPAQESDRRIGSLSLWPGSSDYSPGDLNGSWSLSCVPRAR